MLPLLMSVGIFIVSLIVLIKSSEFFTSSAEKIGLFFGLTPFLIGVTIVAAGTSMPELATCIISVINGASEIVGGNVFGSNIANILLVFGLAMLLSKKQIKPKWSMVSLELPILLISAFLLLSMSLDGEFTFLEALTCLSGYIVYVIYIVTTQRKKKKKKKKKKLGLSPIILILSSIFIYFSAEFLIESVVNISQILNIGTGVIAASIIAIGTSLPEVVVSVMAAKKGKIDIAIGNVLGSNIFNSLVVMGGAGIVGTLIITQGMMTFILPVMIVSSLVFFFLIMRKYSSKLIGFSLLIIYILFLIRILGII